MKCLAIGDVLLPSEFFKVPLTGQPWAQSLTCHDWPVAARRDEVRGVVRKMETLGSRAFLPSEKEIALAADAEVLLAHLYTIPREFFEAAPNLKFILSARGGLENIDLQAARERQVKIIHCPAHNAVAVAEYTIALMLAESRNLARAHNGLMNGTWIEAYPNSPDIPEIRGSTVGIVGFGTIGRLVAQRLMPFGARLLVSDPFVEAQDITALGCEPASLETLLKQSHFVTLHGRLRPGDPPIIGEGELRLMRKDAVLINTARASLIDLDALYAALSEKRIMGAALDVFPKEPLPPGDRFLSLPNVTLTNHRGGDTLNSYIRAPELLAEQFNEYLEKGTTRFLVR